MWSYIDDDEFDGPKGMEKVIAFLTAGHLDLYGGYPYGWIMYKGKVFVASLDDGKERNRTQIDEYDVSYLLEWEKEARKYRKDNPGYPWSGCFLETG